MSVPSRRPRSAMREFLQSEAAGGVILMTTAAIALIIANSPAAGLYFAALHAKLGGLSVTHWINDGLMSLFFLLVGLEIKRELLDGQLSTWRKRILPGAAALAGMAVPAAIFLAFNRGDAAVARGWAIPSATDIAFALGVLALMASRVPVSLKIFLTAVAIIDDLGAVAVIAIFYTSELSLPMLAAAAATTAILAALNRLGVRRLWPYLLLGAVLWAFVFRSGVHATVAGVVLALTIPLQRSPARPDADSPLHRLEHALHPWAAFAVVPIFGFANAGVSLAGLDLPALLEPVTLGVALGLFAGKQLGVFSTVWLLDRLGVADMPEHATARQVYGVSILCGVGFTMSLFIGLLAYPTSELLQAQTKIGILLGSFLSAAAAAAVLLAPARSVEPRTGKTEGSPAYRQPK